MWQKLHACWYAIPIWLQIRQIDERARADYLGSLGCTPGPEAASTSGVVDVERGLGGRVPQEVLLVVVEFCSIWTMVSKVQSFSLCRM